jgi:hypothetical protein
MSILKMLLLFSISILFIQCSTLNTVIEAKADGKGTVKEYDLNYDDAWLLAKKSFRWAGSEIIEFDKDEGSMLTTTGQNWVSSGSVMGAWVEPISDTRTRVTVISKRRISTELFTGMTEDRFHELFIAGYKILKDGGDLPVRPPATD